MARPIGLHEAYATPIVYVRGAVFHVLACIRLQRKVGLHYISLQHY